MSRTVLADRETLSYRYRHDRHGLQFPFRGWCVDPTTRGVQAAAAAYLGRVSLGKEIINLNLSW